MEVAGVEEARVVISSKGCLQRERDALLLYKASIKDPSGCLSSWSAQVDCCAWTGVGCYNRTGRVRVAELYLGNPNVSRNWPETALRGELLHPSLLSLTHLQRLDLSYNDFEGTQIPPLVGSLHKLRYLDLFYSGFGGTIPPHLGNLTNLRHLDLSLEVNFAKAFVHSLHWLSGLSSLNYLGMSSLDLSAASHNWISAVNMLPSLQVLYLYDCRLNIPHYSLSFHLNLTSLEGLILGGNNFDSSFPNWLWNLTSLSYLDLFNSGIQGALPTEIGNLIGLTDLQLSSNLLSGPLPNAIWKLKHLLDLELNDNLLGISFPVGIMNLSSLSTLRLHNCSLSGPLPSELGNLTNLDTIRLSHNSLSGPIPIEIWKLANLNYLHLSDNWFEGEITEFHHSNLTSLDLSYNKINGTLPPTSLQSLIKLNFLNLRWNRLEGLIPHFPPNLNFLDLSYNAFSGTLPPALFMLQLSYLSLSHNHINGSISSNVCNSHILEHLDISNNHVYGEIPQCWQEVQYLQYIHLGNNMLLGEIPSSLGNLMRLEFLHLNNNNLKGHLPSSLQNCTRLFVVDLGDNKFSGNIPLWIGQSWQYLGILRLRSNMFNGNIDPQLGYLRDLQIIDLANNKLSGSIPHSFGNFSTMISTSTESSSLFEEAIQLIDLDWTSDENITLVTKGEQFTFSSILYLVKSIDLSNNDLTDEIPEELGYLVGLYNLNLSRNYFRGKIPDSIGGMSSLETLDLSFNNLSGNIPQSLSKLNALNHLNMSHNNLSGSIPLGHQLQTLDDASIYISNPYLCGDIVNRSCFHGNNTNATSEEHAMLSLILSIYFSSTLGYFVGLWSVFVLLLFKKKWRHSYFKKVDEIYDKVYVTIKIKLNRIAKG
ncbi:receptor-like protein 38 [Zingiber officinale]|uniref:receptor-like protein 38 n=1 Tax=Zingiber officinale TaxID=94328 RepID=UPI001C4BE0D2|nr:receptor-like protein 38 [Zingiber officinale]